MKRLLRYLRQSLSARLSLGLVFFASLVFLVTLGIMFVQSRKAVREEAISGAEQVLDNTYVIGPDGVKRKLEKKKEKEPEGKAE